MSRPHSSRSVSPSINSHYELSCQFIDLGIDDIRVIESRRLLLPAQTDLRFLLVAISGARSLMRLRGRVLYPGPIHHHTTLIKLGLIS
jgi:hypothetical protein